MLHLKLPTDPRWADLAHRSIIDILQDHAFCEQKAASTCISLIVQNSENQALVEAVSPVVAEEWAHFERVVEELRKRGHGLGEPRKDEYVIGLQKFLKKDGHEDQRLVDKLLMCALIEARSCERFKTLWKNLPDEELQQFYYEFMVSEARHYVLFLNLARDVMDREYVDARWQAFLDFEKELLKTLEPRGDRMH